MCSEALSLVTAAKSWVALGGLHDQPLQGICRNNTQLLYVRSVIRAMAPATLLGNGRNGLGSNISSDATCVS